MNLKQLAQELNLSISAVSKALRDSHEISAATKNAVLSKAKELNYQVNPFASSLRKQKSKTIAVIIPEVVNDFFGPVINGIESIAQEKQYHVLIYLTHEDMQKEVAITKLLQSGRVDGVMVSLSATTSDTKHIEALKEKSIPMVFFDRIAEDIDVPKVITNDCKSGNEATAHLIEKGCKRIAFISISNKLSITHKRMKGYCEALENDGIEKDESLVINCDGDELHNTNLIRILLQRTDRPDGIFACVESLAIIVYEVCKQLQLRIPEDVKVICFSNLKTAGWLCPSMTTITQPAYEIGREAASILFRLIEKKGHQFIYEKTVINSVLVARNSTK